MLGILLVFCVRLFQPFSLRDGSIYFGTAPWHYLDTSDTQRAHRILSRPNDIFVQTCRRELGTSDVAHVLILSRQTASTRGL